MKSPSPRFVSSRAAGVLHAILEIIGGAAAAALMLLIVCDALLRSFANRPIAGSNDFAQVILVIVVACSLPLCVGGGRAITIDLLTDLLPGSARSMLRRLTSIACAVALAYLAWRCVLNAREATYFGETTMLMQIPFGPFYLALAIGFALSALQFVADAIRPAPSP